MGNEKSTSQQTNENHVPIIQKSGSFSGPIIPQKDNKVLTRSHSTTDTVLLEKQLKAQNNFKKLYKKLKLKLLCRDLKSFKKNELHLELMKYHAMSPKTKSSFLTEIKTRHKNNLIKKELSSHQLNKLCYGEVLEKLVESRKPVDPYATEKLKEIGKLVQKRNKIRKECAMLDENDLRNQIMYLKSRVLNLETKVEALEKKNDNQMKFIENKIKYKSTEYEKKQENKPIKHKTKFDPYAHLKPYGPSNPYGYKSKPFGYE